MGCEETKQRQTINSERYFFFFFFFFFFLFAVVDVRGVRERDKLCGFCRGSRCLVLTKTNHETLKDLLKLYPSSWIFFLLVSAKQKTCWRADHKSRRRRRRRRRRPSSLSEDRLVRREIQQSLLSSASSKNETILQRRIRRSPTTTSTLCESFRKC